MMVQTKIKPLRVKYNTLENPTKWIIVDVYAQTLSQAKRVILKTNKDAVNFKLLKNSFTKLDNVYYESVIRNDTEFVDTLDELNSLSSFIANYFKKFGIAQKTKTFSDEKGATSKIRQILQKAVTPKKVPGKDGEDVFVPSKTVGEIQGDMKNAVVKYSDGKPNFRDWQLKRVANTELSAMRETAKLLKWRDMFGGKQTVKDIASNDNKTGEDSKAMDGCVFEIDFLLENPWARIPHRPNNRSTYRLTRENPMIKSSAQKWLNIWKRGPQWKKGVKL